MHARYNVILLSEKRPHTVFLVEAFKRICFFKQQLKQNLPVDKKMGF